MSARSVITTITAAADSLKLTTVENIRADLNLFDTSVTDDYIDRLNSQCSRAAAQYCNREFALQGYRDAVRPTKDARQYFLPNDLEFIVVANWPLIAVSAITENGIALVAGTDFEADATNGIVYRLNSNGDRRAWSCGEILIDYQAGWTLPEQTTPGAGANKLLDTAPDVEDAVIRMCKAQYMARGRDPSLMSQDVPGMGPQRWWVGAGSITPDISGKLDNYRILSFA